MIFKSDTYMQRKAPIGGTAEEKELIVPLTSDRGLCGAINSSIVRDLKADISKKNRSRVALLPVGEKGTAGLLRPFPDLVKLAITDLQTPYNYPTVMAVSEIVNQQSQGYDKITVVYNEFVSAIASVIRKVEIMPRKRFLETMKFGHLYNQTRPDKNTSNPALYDLYIAANLWTALLNNAASEQSARMNAMENASKNAKELVERLTLEYNKARQARITMELVEIISGASAL